LYFGYGCSLLQAAMTGPGLSDPASGEEPAEAQKRAEEREAAKAKAAEEEAAREKAIFDDIELMRKELAATKDPGKKAEDFAKRVIEAGRTSAARSGKVEMPKLHAEAAGYLELAIQKKPSLEAFDSLTALPSSDETDRAVLASCARVRPLVPEDGVVHFAGVCLDSAGGDAKKLKWASAARDVAAYKKAEGERVAAQAKAEAVEKAQQSKTARHVAAAVFASGRCKFSNCLKDGWTARTPEGDVDVSCSFSNCFKDGWTARFPDGTQSTTRCSFSDCMKDGWTTTFPDGTQSTTRCSFSNCLKDGWTTDLPGGGTATTRCSFSDCSKDGWTTDLPGGGSVQCRCNFSKCFEDGATCG
jgi:hypothetical protein